MIDFAHVGLHKSGSTFLQYSFFKNHPELYVVGKEGGTCQNPGLTKRLLALNQTEPDHFEPEAFRKAFHQGIQAENPHQPVKGISNEQLSGKMLSGRRADLIAERIHAVFGPVKVILIFRHPVRWIESVYSTYIRQRGTVSYQQFLKNLGDPRQEHYAGDKLNFKKLLYKYYSLFGEERVLPLPYELLRQNPEALNQRISAFLGIRHRSLDNLKEVGVINPRLEPFDEWLIRNLNKIWLPKPSGKKIHLGRTYAKLRRDTGFSYPEWLNAQFRTSWQVQQFRIYELIQQYDYALYPPDLAAYNYQP
jgi:hypothetical protein